MANLIVTITNQKGQPLQGVILQSGQYNTSPCPFGSTTCTTGNGSPISGTTDENGQCSFPIPYTCVGEWSGNWYIDGYDLLPWDQSTGYVTGDVYWTLVMVASSTSGRASGAGNAGAGGKGAPTTTEGNIPDQGAADLAGTAPAGQAITDWFSQYWWLIVILVILIVVIILALHYHGGAPKVSAPSLPKVQ